MADKSTFRQLYSRGVLNPFDFDPAHRRVAVLTELESGLVCQIPATSGDLHCIALQFSN